MAKKKTQYFFDTSIFMLYVKADPKVQNLFKAHATSQGKTYASFFTLLELNKYFITIGIELFEKIEELDDISSAKIFLSDSYGRRNTYYLIIDGLVDRGLQSTDIQYNVRNYLARLEILIVNLQDEIYDMVNVFVGNFQKHPIVNSRIFSKEDFLSHKSTISSNKKIDYSSNWASMQLDLDQINQYLNALPKLKKQQREIQETVQKILSDFETKETKYFGDITIGLDAPTKTVIVAKDHSFETIAPALSKQLKYTNTLF